jgi:hypothetical protein
LLLFYVKAGVSDRSKSVLGYLSAIDMHGVFVKIPPAENLFNPDESAAIPMAGSSSFRFESNQA